MPISFDPIIDVVHDDEYESDAEGNYEGDYDYEDNYGRDYYESDSDDEDFLIMRSMGRRMSSENVTTMQLSDEERQLGRQEPIVHDNYDDDSDDENPPILRIYLRDEKCQLTHQVIGR